MTAPSTSEYAVRQRAARLGYIVRKSRRGWPLEIEGEFMLVEANRNIPALGYR